MAVTVRGHMVWQSMVVLTEFSGVGDRREGLRY